MKKKWKKLKKMKKLKNMKKMKKIPKWPNRPKWPNDQNDQDVEHVDHVEHVGHAFSGLDQLDSCVFFLNFLFFKGIIQSSLPNKIWHLANIAKNSIIDGYNWSIDNFVNSFYPSILLLNK